LNRSSSFRRGLRGLIWTLAATASLAAAAEQQVIDDFTTYSYAQGAAGIGTEADLPVSRTFPGRIVSLVVTIVAGKADDIGFVGNMQVTNQFPQCRDVGAVTAPVDVTSQVTVSGDTASFLLRAIENCCCSTGWGPATQGDRPPATFHWQAVIDTSPVCDGEPSCSAKACAPSEPPDISRTANLDFTRHFATEACRTIGGGTTSLDIKMKGTGKVAPLTCEASCKTTDTAKADFSASGKLCGFTLPETTFGLDYERETRTGTTCDADCKQQCDAANACVTHDGSATIGLGKQQTVGNGIKFNHGTTFLGNRFAVNADCKFQYELTGALGLKAGITDKHGEIDDCTQCAKDGITLNTSASGTAQCDVKFTAGTLHEDFGCEECAKAELTTDLDIQDATGACENQTCFKTGWNLSGSLNIPVHCLNFLGFVAQAGVSGKAESKCTDNTCGETADEIHKCEIEPKLSMDVTFSMGPNVKCGGAK
jgi:hypothetical protein